MNIGREHWIIIRGNTAYWGGMTAGPVRSSGLFPSHAAVEGVLRQILGKMEIRWDCREARILSLGRHPLVETTNALKHFTSQFLPGSTIQAPIANEAARHTSRTQTYLTDVVYAFRGHMTLTSKARPGASILKYDGMYDRRVSKGQQYRRLYLGVSECLGSYESIPGPPDAEPLDINADLGVTYFDTDWDGSASPKMYYHPMQVVRGVLHYPTWDEVRALGLCRTRRAA